MTDYHAKLIRAIDRERSSLERMGARLSMCYARTAKLHALSAARLGYDPAQAVADVLRGESRLGLSGLAPALAGLAFVSHLTGLRRAQILAKALGSNSTARPVMLSRETDEERERRKREESLLLLLLLDDYEIFALRQRYVAYANEQVSRMVRHVTQYIGETLAAGGLSPFSEAAAAAGTGAEPPAHTPVSGAPFAPIYRGRGYSQEAVRLVLRSAGVASENPFLLETVTGTAVNTAHGDGWWDGITAPQVAAKVKGYMHSSVLDDRTTDICIERDGLTLPVDDPYWRHAHPPLHWNCRSVILPVFTEMKWSTRLPIIPPQPGFGFGPWPFAQAAA